MKTIILAAAGILLAIAPAQADTTETCRTRIREHSHAAVAKCVNRLEASAMRSMTPHHDLVRWAEAQRLVIAEQADRGELTDAAVNAKWNEVVVAFNTEIQKRNRPVQQAPAVVVQQQQKAVTFCNTLGMSTICF